MKKIIKIALVAGGLLLALAVTGFVVLLNLGPSAEDFAHLQQPRIVAKQETMALKAKFDGDPEKVIKEAYGKLFSVYYGMDGVSKWPGEVAPLARYEGFDELIALVGEAKLKEVPWRGFVAIPVPQTSALPDDASQGPYPVYLETLAYGTVAEIVHFGPYEEEKPAIEKLKQHIVGQGYEIAGLHEEEYIKGPGLLPVDPKDYITIIRYQVRKRDQG